MSLILLGFLVSLAVGLATGLGAILVLFIKGVPQRLLDTMGGNGEHLRLKLQQGGTVWDGVGFRLGNYLAEASSPLDIVYNLEIDRWSGEERLRLNILDFAPAR